MGIALGMGGVWWADAHREVRASPSMTPPEGYSRYEKLSTFTQALATLEQQYVLPVDSERLIEGAIEGMVARLDPHTAYLPPDEATMLLEDIDGRFGGVGIVVLLRREPGEPMALEISEVLDGGPAQAGGLVAGERIVGIEGRAVATYVDLFEAVATMRGPVGSTVSFQVQGVDGVARDVSLVRARIESEPVRAERLEDDVGWISLRDFQANSTDAIREAMKTLGVGKKGGVTALILDLRDNGGGLLDEAIGVVDLFVSRGVIVRTRARGGALVSEARATASGTFRKVPLVVLINKGSASASEIVAAALQDHGRAAIVGTRSYGKGSVQSPRSLPNGGLLKFTTALYYTPYDRVIQAAGVVPDVHADGGARAPFDGRPGLITEDEVDGHLPPDALGVGKIETRPPTPASDPVSRADRPMPASDGEAPLDASTLRAMREAVDARQLEAAITQAKLLRRMQRKGR